MPEKSSFAATQLKIIISKALLDLEPIPKFIQWRNRAKEINRIRTQEEAAEAWQIATSHKVLGWDVFGQLRQGECSRSEFWDRLLVLMRGRLVPGFGAVNRFERFLFETRDL